MILELNYWVLLKTKLELLACSKNPSTRYNAVDIISTIIESPHLAKGSTNLSLENQIDILLERWFDASSRVRKKSIEILCKILENSEELSKNNDFLTRKGLLLITELLNAIISKKEDGPRVVKRVTEFLNKILFDNYQGFIVESEGGKKQKK